MPSGLIAMLPELGHYSHAEMALWGLAALFILYVPFFFLFRAFGGARDKAERSGLPAQIKNAMPRDARQAHLLFLKYRALGGKPDCFSAEEIYRIFASAGRAEDLPAQAASLSEAQLLGVAKLLSAKNRHLEAVRLLSNDPYLFSTLPSDEACEVIIEIYERAGKLKDLINEKFSGKPHEIVLAFARAFIRLGKHAECVHLLILQSNKIPGEFRLLAETLSALGREQEALDALEQLGKLEWTDGEYIACFKLAAKLGRLDRSEKLYARVARIMPIKKDPELHYDFALRCEAAGKAALAADVYRAFIAADLSYRDVIERYKALKGPDSVPEPAIRVAFAPPTPAEDDVLAGKYELGRTIGEGGMGIILEAFDRKLGRKVAIKRMRTELSLNARHRERFLQEAKIISHLTHPYIVGIHEILEHEGRIFLVFDFVDGRTLSAILDDKKRLSLAECKKVFDCVCQAMDSAHRSKVLHRDLKPGNIMVDKEGFVKVMDFGLAREAKDSLSKITSTDASGTPAYMAPEQHLGHAVRASDIYSVGICLYETLTGDMPFKGPDFLEQKKIMQYAPVRSLASELPKEIDILMAAALQADPKKRIADALELWDLLKAL